MKTRIATLTFLIGLFISATAFASEPAPIPASKAVASSVAQFVEQNLEYPEFAIKEKFEGDVVVDLVILEDGSFDVKAANSVSNEMQEHVIGAIEKMIPRDYSKYAGQRVLIRVKFDLELS